MRGKFEVNVQKVYVRGDLSLEFRNHGSCYVVEVENRGRRHKVYFGTGGDVRRVEDHTLTPAAPSATGKA